MTLLDLLLAFLLVSAVLSGWQVGFVARLAGWAGVLAGLGIAYWTVPFALAFASDATAGTKLLVAVGALIVSVGGSALLLESVGRSLADHVATTSLAPLDRAVGALAGVLVVVATAWLVLPAATALPDPFGRQASDAAASRLLTAVAPAPPDITGALSALIADGPFPDIVAELGPVRAAGPPPTDLTVPPAVIEQATAATVRVTARGCGARFDGSGVAIAGGLVATNAHVVAGSDEVELRRPDGAVRPGRVVAFDPDRDLALIQVEELGQQPLPLGTADAGQEVAIIGYPGGQPQPRVAPARIQQRRTALGRDIYELAETERQVLFLSAELRRGDSGAPLVTADGEVVGLVFAVSPDRSTTAYALDRREVDAILAAPRITGATGRCLVQP